ncbi:hypothetical protein ACWD4B_00830 [Streptomyces sp. NPDC002536]
MLGGSDGSGHMASRHSRVRRDVREDRAITAISALQQVLPK